MALLRYLKNFPYRSLLWALGFLLLRVTPCHAAEVLLLADTKLKPVVEIVSGLVKSLRVPFKTYSPAGLRGDFAEVVEAEHAKVVIALGREALTEALRLPSHVVVIYDMVVIPPHITRPNTTGFYMATPAREYGELVGNYLRDLDRIAVVGTREQLNVLARSEWPGMSNHGVRSSVELVHTLQQLDQVDAILLLPDVSLLTAAAMEQAYLLSFRRRIPILGISEKQVKEGALLALVVDPANVGRLIGEYANRALRGVNVGQLPPSPPKKFDLFLNLDTARRMGIRFPEELLRSAKRVYP